MPLASDLRSDAHRPTERGPGPAAEGPPNSDEQAVPLTWHAPTSGTSYKDRFTASPAQSEGVSPFLRDSISHPVVTLSLGCTELVSASRAGSRHGSRDLPALGRTRFGRLVSCWCSCRPRPRWRSTFASEAEVADKSTSWILRPPDAIEGRRLVEPARRSVERRLRPVNGVAAAAGEDAPVAWLHLLRARPGKLRSMGSETR